MRRTSSAVANGCSVISKGSVVYDDLSRYLLARLFQFIESSNDQYFRGYSILWRTNTISQSQHSQVTFDRCDHLQTLRTSHPVGNHYLLGAHIIRSILPRFRRSPLNRAGM